MEELKSKIFTVILHIERYCGLQVVGRYDMAEQYIPIITEKLKDVIPRIIKTGSNKESSDEVDSSLWIMMLKRIIDAMGLDDIFIKIDAFADMGELLKNYCACLEMGNE